MGRKCGFRGFQLRGRRRPLRSTCNPRPWHRATWKDDRSRTAGGVDSTPHQHTIEVDERDRQCSGGQAREPIPKSSRAIEPPSRAAAAGSQPLSVRFEDGFVSSRSRHGGKTSLACGECARKSLEDLRRRDGDGDGSAMPPLGFAQAAAVEGGGEPQHPVVKVMDQPVISAM